MGNNNIFEKKKILIVDDSEINRSLLSDMLSDEYDILEAEHGMEASAILHDKEQEISLMLLACDGWIRDTGGNEQEWLDQGYPGHHDFCGDGACLCGPGL